MEVNDFVRLRIRELRMTKQLRVRDVARRAGIPMGSYSCLEAGRYRLQLDSLCRILLALEASITEVWPAGPVSVPALIDDDMIQQLVGEAYEKERQARVQPADLLSAVARVYGLSTAELYGKSRRRPLVEARAVASLLTHGLPFVTKTELALEMGRDASSLVHAAARLKDRLPPTQLAQILRNVNHELKELLRLKIEVAPQSTPQG